MLHFPAGCQFVVDFFLSVRLSVFMCPLCLLCLLFMVVFFFFFGGGGGVKMFCWVSACSCSCKCLSFLGRGGVVMLSFFCWGEVGFGCWALGLFFGFGGIRRLGFRVFRFKGETRALRPKALNS